MSFKLKGLIANASAWDGHIAGEEATIMSFRRLAEPLARQRLCAVASLR